MEIMKRKRKQLKFKKARVILSDILPYEIPITYSNRHFYDFLITNKVQLVNGKIYVGNTDAVVQETLKLLLGIKHDHQFMPSGEIALKDATSIAFGFKIAHKENDFRELSIIHPKNQLCLIEFYDKYKDLILYYSSLSPFSIRKPHKIAKYTYFKDQLHLEKLAELGDTIEQNDKEYENLRTFFVYKKYSNIHKFYESYQYHRSEKKYDKLFKFDISKCFDSIYTHSISWALLDKSTVKKYMTESKSTLGGEFDSLIQKLNYNETNGIVIGPEFSRIFAELILQKIDVCVKQELEAEGIFFKRDYEIFRYVDDYFVFYNDDRKKEKILTLFRLKLKEFKLYLNDAKTLHYDKPIITEITIAKQKITDLLNRNICYQYEDILIETSPGKTVEKTRGTINIDSNRLITKFKTIIYESKVEYKDVLNYTFSIIERKLGSVIKGYFKIEQEKNTQKQFIGSLLELLDFVFFIYAISPRVNSTIKLCRILRLITETLNLPGQFNTDLKHLIFKKIYDNIFLILHKNETIKHTQVETLYLLIALQELGKEYWLAEDILAHYLCIKKNEANVYTTNAELNYFTIIVSIFYMKDKVRYNELRSFIIEKLIEKFEQVDYKFRIQKAELTFLLFDTMVCPYIDIAVKRRILSLYEIKTNALQDQIMGLRDTWFTNWADFEFGKELDAKNSQEVY